jgi:Immunity protein 50
MNMHAWSELVGGADKIGAIFSNSPPNLTDVDLHEITLHRDGPHATLCFDLLTYPAFPPRKWQTQNFNKVQMRLMCFGLSSVSINGWQKKCKINLTLQRKDDLIAITGSNRQIAIEMIADAVELTDISAYHDSA